MKERFKPFRVKTAKFYLQTQGCSWCTDRVAPTTGGICGKCVEGFKRLLTSHDWRKTRIAKLQREPFCVCGCERPADTVDHIQQWRTHPHLFWEGENHQSMHHTCHQIKTNREKLTKQK